MSIYIKSEFIKNAGGCIVSKNILEENGRLKWLVRDESVTSVDNGWRFFSDIDDDDYVNDPDNLVVCDFNTVVQFEPAILAVYSFPVGSDLQLVVEKGRCYFIDNITEEVIEFLYH